MGQTITLNKEVPVIAGYDAVVCGGGPSGLMAAIAAARGGARTALIERYGFLGGMATAGLVSPISEFMYNGRLVEGGIPWEFVQRMEAVGGAKVELPLGNVSFKPEIFKLVAQRMLLEAGVTLYLHAYLSACQKGADNRITHVVFESKSGTEALSARQFVDCSGDADLACMAGVPMTTYQAPLQPATLYFTLGGVDAEKIEKIHHSEQGINYHIESLQSRLREIARTEAIPNFGGPWMIYMLNDSMVQVNMTRIEANMADEREQTRAECTLREDAHKLVDVLRRHFDLFRNAYIVSTATQAGVRETRHVRGTHTLTAEEYRTTVHFPDSIGRGAHPIDIHSAKDSNQKCEFLKEAAYIPYRSLIIDGYPNLLVAGRSFSADREAFGSARVMGCMMGLGQAAGYAAAMAVKQGRSVHEIDVDALRETLIRIGANI